MNKEEFMRDMERSLNGISEEERTEILYDYREHFMIGKASGKTEEEICLELGNPQDIASSYLLSRSTEPVKLHVEEEFKTNSSFVSHRNRSSIFIASCIAVGLLLFAFAGYASITRNNASAIKIDNSGIHGNGIVIDSNGVKVPGVSIDNNGINAPGVNIDNNGVKIPGISIDYNGIKLPGITIDNNGIKFNK